MCVQTGVVGYWSCETDENEIVKLEDEYIAKWNLLWDFKIIFEMILRYLSFHSKRKNYIEEMREQALEQGLEQGIQGIVESCQELGASRDMAVAQLMKKFDLEEQSAQEKVDKYWKAEI